MRKESAKKFLLYLLCFKKEEEDLAKEDKIEKNKKKNLNIYRYIAI